MTNPLTPPSGPPPVLIRGLLTDFQPDAVAWLPPIRDSIDAAMRSAIDAARGAPRPYGAAAVDARTGSVSGAEATDPMDLVAHAEINVLRAARRAGIDTSTLILVATAEPCAMCAGAAAWAKVRAVVAGTTIESLNAFGWREFYCPPEQLASTAPFWYGPWIVGYLSSETDPLYSGHPPSHYGMGPASTR